MKKPRIIKSLQELEQGDIVRHRMSNNSYTISANYEEYVIGVKTIHISNPDEWLLVKKAHYNKC